MKSGRPLACSTPPLLTLVGKCKSIVVESLITRASSCAAEMPTIQNDGLRFDAPQLRLQQTVTAATEVSKWI
jgi:hypothetical protein